MVDFASLDHETRTVALVGTFLQKWAGMEAGVNTAIGNILGLTVSQAAIVTKNIQFRSKIHILSTAIALSKLPQTERDAHVKTLLAISEYSKYRNMVAHDYFSPAAKGDGVDFFVVKAASGKFDLPDENWAVSRFEAEFSQLAAWSSDAWTLARHFSTHETLAEVLLRLAKESQSPTEAPFSLADLGAGYRQPPSPPSSNPEDAMPQTDRKSGPDHPE